MFGFGRKKKDAAANKKHAADHASPTSSVKRSFLSLEQRLMFDAAAAATASEVASEQVAQEQAEAAVSSEAGADGQTREQTDSQGVLDAITAYNPGASRSEVVFVDPTVPNYQDLLGGMDPNVEVIMLDGGQDGIEQMANALSGRTGVDAIHVISHGGAGELQLGTGVLNADSMSTDYVDDLAVIQQSLSEQADILVYGCEFAQGEAGQAAVDMLAELTGADVQASTDLTGSISLGGDWEFEVSTGTIETSLAINYDAQMNWAEVLGTETVKDTFSTESYSNNNGTQSWSTSWSETDAGGSGASGGDVRVNSSQLRIDTDSVGNAISRGVNLSNATSATLTFSYTNSLSGADRIELRVSTDGGSNYQTVSGGVFSNAANTGSGTAHIDLSGYMSANTRIQFIVTGTGGGDRLYVDNVQISYETGPTNSAPTITSNSGGAIASITVAENTTAVTTVTATDANAGQTLTYSISGGADASKFTINSSTGQLSFVAAPNYEAPTDSGGNNVYDVTVQVSDGNGGTDTQAIAVTVTDSAESSTILAAYEPALSSMGDQAYELKSDQSWGQSFRYDSSASTYSVDQVGLVLYRASDAPQQTLTVSIRSSWDGSVIASGTISSTSLGTREAWVNVNFTSPAVLNDGASYCIRVEATGAGKVYAGVNDSGTYTGGTLINKDGVSEGNKDMGFRLQSTNVSNSSPAITSQSGSATASMSVAENSSTVTTVTATDADAGQSLTYSIAGGADAAQFTINSSTGQLSFVAAPNYETPTDSGGNNVYDVTVQVSDGQGGTDTKAIAVTVTNVNEGPTDLSLSANTVTEHATTGTVVGTVSGTDPDAGDTKTYSLTDTAGGRFAINASTGQLTVADGSLLNYEAAASHTVTVRVTDSGGQHYLETFTINLTNVNEGPTDLSLSANSVAENAATGTVVGTVGGTDSDSGDTKTYSLTDTAGGRFAINSSTGVITVANGTLLNYESAQSHNITVQVSDRGGLTYHETFAINLTNVNEGPTGADVTVTLSEDTAHTLTTANFGFSDVDAGDSLSAVRIDTIPSAGSLTLSGMAVTAGQVVSAVDITAGRLVFSPAENATGTGYASVTFSVRDSNNAYDAAPNTLTFNVTAVNDAPTDLSLSANTVVENATTGTVVGTVTGTDPDAGDTKSYSLTDTAGGRFAINSSTGQLTVANGSLLNYEAAASHSVTVRVTDAGGLTYDETFTINLTNVNEGPTDLNLSANTVVENATTGTIVGTVSGTDPDAGDTKTYSLTDTAGGRFAISASTGVITVADGSLLNYESAASHNVTVQVTDSGGQRYTEQFTINLTNVNEGPTDLSLSANSVAENATTGTVVGIVSGTDADAGDTQSYSLTDTAGGRFAIDASTGEITVADGSLLNYESSASHSVTVQVTDSGGQSYTETFTINLTNVNEVPTGADATVTINEDTSHIFTTANFGSSDVDAGDTLSAVRIDTLPSAGSLTLSGVAVTAGQVITVADITAGNLVFTSAADASGTGYAHFTFSVRDSGNLYDAAPNILTFNVTPVNDAPINAVPEAQTVNEDTPLALSGVSVTDVDGNVSTVQLGVGNGTLTVTLAGGATISAGSNSSGALTLSGSQADINATLATLVYQGAFNYNGADTLTVTSTDSNNVTDTDTVAITVTPVNDATVVTGGTSSSGTEDTTLTGTLTAIDVEGLSDGSVYSVTGAATNGTASIDSATGLWSYTPTADFNGSDSFTVTITDDAGNTSTQVVSVTVTPVNDAPTDLSLSAISIAENAAMGTVVGTVTGIDPDAGDTKTYSLTDTAGGRFAINASTGEITVADGSLLNYEDATSHSVTVRVTDAGGQTYDERFSINLANVNEAPTDLSLSASSVAENAITGTVVGTVSGADSDSRDTKTYSLTDTAGGRFAINSSTGVITVANGALLNYESAQSHDITVQVTDRGGLTYRETFAINLTNVNETPTISSQGGGSTGSVTVAENGTSVTTVMATDSDVGQTLTYSIVGGADAAQFTINSSTGQLSFLGAPNYEVPTDGGGNNIYDVTVQVSDGQGGTDTQAIAVSVTNVNETPTDLSLSANSVAENATTGTVVGTVTGTDPDASDTKTYSLTDTAGGRFAINASTGVITVADGSLLNYESAASHSLTVRVTDSGGQSYTESFTISLTNVNEGPTDLSLSANSVAENATTGTVVGTVTGTDPDAGDTKTYSLTDTAGGRFAINASTGVITVADGSLLNYESAASHNLTVRVTDSGGQSYTESFTINLTNVNEGPTDLALSANSVAENATTGTVVGTVTGTDPDANDTKTYSLTDTAGGRFAINASTGVITVADGSLLNYESAASHNLTVQVTDSAGQSYTEQFTINLTNVNEGPTDLALSANTVAENASTGTVVGTVSGTDPDAGDTKTYSLTDTAGGRFAINASTGVITVADGSLLNYESAASHNLTVQVTDSAGQSYTEQFTINLTNVNEGPTDLALSANSVAENATTGTVVGTVTGTDPDAGDTKTYSLTDTAGGRFAINASTGVITVADGSLLNYESAASHNLTVRVTDSGGQSYTESFTINLTNVNEGLTDLSLSANSVAENASTGTVVGTVSGTDPDAGDTKTYSLTDTAGGRFAINASTGVITVADGSLLNYEAAASHSLTVRVTDSGGQSYTESFTINLTNVNEGPTDLSLSGSSVAENASAGTVVGTVSGTDPDASDTKTYSLTDTAGGRFAINASSGVITVADGSLLNYEAAASHNLTVRVTDSGGQSYTESFTINLTNVNEGPTDLSLSANTVAEQASTGTVVGIVSGTDLDASDTQTYSLTDTAGGRFAIDAGTGQLTVADGSLLNYDAAASHSVTVQVTDSGGQTHTETFTINLTNVNEGPTDVQRENGGGPPFLHSNWQVAFEGSARPSFLSQIKDDTGEGEGRVPDDVRKPVEWRSQPASLLDALRPDRTLAGRAHDGDEAKAVGSKQERASAPSPRTVDETAVNLDAANAARPELEQVPQPPTAETGNVPDDSGGLGVPMAVGLAGAVLQGQLGKKEKMTTLTGQSPARDRQPAKEQNSEQPSVDDQVVPPRQP